MVFGMNTARRMLAVLALNLWNDGDGMAAVCARGSAAFCRYLPSLTESGDYVGEQ